MTTLPHPLGPRNRLSASAGGPSWHMCTYTTSFCRSCQNVQCCASTVGDRRSRGIPNREIEREGPAQRLRERGQAIVHPDRPPRRHGRTLGHVADHEGRRVVPRDPVGELANPARASTAPRQPGLASP